MKNNCFTFFSLCLSLTVFAQKYDNQWIVPGRLLPSVPAQKQLILNFETDSPLPNVEETDLGLIYNQSNTSICDPETGELLFYSDGTKVFNADHVLMSNGDSILSLIHI